MSENVDGRVGSDLCDLLGPLVDAAGMVNVLNHGSGSCVYSEGCHGVTQEHLERFAALVRESLLDRVRQALLDTSEEGDGDYADHLFERILQGLGNNAVPQDKTRAEHRALRMALRGMVDAARRVDLDRPTFGDCQAMRNARAALALVDG